MSTEKTTVTDNAAALRDWYRFVEEFPECKLDLELKQDHLICGRLHREDCRG